MARINLNLPHNLSNVPMTTSDQLYIIVTADCSWCYSPDPSAVFPTFLAAGSYTATIPPTTYGPYNPATTGAVTYNAVTTGDCTTASPAATPRSITVT